MASNLSKCKCNSNQQITVQIEYTWRIYHKKTHEKCLYSPQSVWRKIKCLAPWFSHVCQMERCITLQIHTITQGIERRVRYSFPDPLPCYELLLKTLRLLKANGSSANSYNICHLQFRCNGVHFKGVSLVLNTRDICSLPYSLKNHRDPGVQITFLMWGG